MTYQIHLSHRPVVTHMFDYFQIVVKSVEGTDVCGRVISIDSYDDVRKSLLKDTF